MERIEAKEMERASHSFGCIYCIERGEKDDFVNIGEECYKNGVCCGKSACIAKYVFKRLRES